MDENLPLLLRQFSWTQGYELGFIQVPTSSLERFIVPMFGKFSGSGSSLSTSRPKARSSPMSEESTFVPQPAIEKISLESTEFMAFDIDAQRI